MIKKTILLSLICLCFQNMNAQDTLNFHISGALDMYYGNELGESGNERPDFLYNHHRVNEFALNFGLIKFSVDNQHVRSNIGIMTGTYPERNLASEPAVFRNIYEANAGVALNKASNLWLDAGIFPSHIGFESAISGDNMTMTRSLVAENTPYYLSGAKLNYAPNDKLNLGLTVCNGWQRIRKSEEKLDNSPAIGTQISYTFNENVSVNWSTYLGYDEMKSLKTKRFYNNFYTNIKATDKLKFIVGFDIGRDSEKYKGGLKYDNYIWYAPVLITQYAWSPKFRTAFRIENLKDDYNIISKYEQIYGYSFNLDYEPYPKALIRLEYRNIRALDDIIDTQDNQLLQLGLFYQFKKDFR
jgi:hypothetical protein